MTFTKEQLIERVKNMLRAYKGKVKTHPEYDGMAADVELLEIALAALTAPVYIPLHVEDAMADMCDGGFNAQGIWDLCRESIMPPKPCPCCGTTSDRPDGGHYCHVGSNS
ncbi:hypothetical protein [Enterobacter sp. 22466]|uniref:hypothetical protein n=1 Tax=Enterobacter sp. 22466 TaxID=3453924 RepID=UPI003F831F78